MLSITNAEAQELANRYGKPLIVVTVRDHLAAKGTAYEQCVTTVVQEAQQWRKQWQSEYSAEDGHKITTTTYTPSTTTTQATPAHVSLSRIREFLSSLHSCYASDRTTAQALNVKHCRSGKVESKCPVKEARGVAVVAYGYDELGNVCAICADGLVRQFIPGAPVEVTKTQSIPKREPALFHATREDGSTTSFDALDMAEARSYCRRAVRIVNSETGETWEAEPKAAQAVAVASPFSLAHKMHSRALVECLRMVRAVSYLSSRATCNFVAEAFMSMEERGRAYDAGYEAFTRGDLDAHAHQVNIKGTAWLAGWAGAQAQADLEAEVAALRASDLGAEIGETGPDWEPTARTKYYAQVGNLFAFGPTQGKALDNLETALTRKKSQDIAEANCVLVPATVTASAACASMTALCTGKAQPQPKKRKAKAKRPLFRTALAGGLVSLLGIAGTSQAGTPDATWNEVGFAVATVTAPTTVCAFPKQMRAIADAVEAGNRLKLESILTTYGPQCQLLPKGQAVSVTYGEWKTKPESSVVFATVLDGEDQPTRYVPVSRLKLTPKSQGAYSQWLRKQ